MVKSCQIDGTVFKCHLNSRLLFRFSPLIEMHLNTELPTGQLPIKIESVNVMFSVNWFCFHGRKSGRLEIWIMDMWRMYHTETIWLPYSQFSNGLVTWRTIWITDLSGIQTVLFKLYSDCQSYLYCLPCMSWPLSLSRSFYLTLFR